MTCYEISARIRYDYDPPASPGRTLLRLMPADLPGRQRLIAGQIAASPAPAERQDRMDFWGNRVTEVAFRAPASTASFTLRARVERLWDGVPTDQSVALGRLEDEIAAATTLGPGSPHHFLGPSARIPASGPIAAFVRTAVGRARTTRRAVEAAGHALHVAMAFDATATTVDTPPDEAFRLRRGVCQDLAQVMIAGLRGLGVPAAYVSGFLRTTPLPGQPRLEGADAMHAWVRAWCGGTAGWTEYDPTNACFAGPDHIVVAYGRDYDDVAPVQGVLRTSGGQTSSQSVDTRPLEAP